MDTLQFSLRIADAALDKQAVDPILLRVEELVSYADYVLILTAKSAPHSDAIVESCVARAKEQGIRPLAIEGKGKSWCLIDFGDIVLHIFMDHYRGYYDLEGLWHDAPRIEIPGIEPVREPLGFSI
jgi:ribosome-associated protein